jgi:hypothetical protein
MQTTTTSKLLANADPTSPAVRRPTIPAPKSDGPFFGWGPRLAS